MPITIAKVTNPDLVLRLAPHIEDYIKIVGGVGIYASTFTAYLMQTVAGGGDMAEFWIALDGDEPVGFVRFNVLGLPYISDISVDAFYSWTKNLKVAHELVMAIVGFARKHKAKRMHGYCYDERLFNHFKKLLSKHLDYNMEKTNLIFGEGEFKWA